MSRWTYRYTLLAAALATVVGLCALTARLGTPAAGAAGSISVVRHLGGVVRAVYAADSYLLWGRGAALEVYSADGADRLGGLLLPSLIADIDVDGGIAYVAAADGLYWVDLASLSAPVLMGHLPPPALTDEGAVSAVRSVGGYAFVGLEDAGLWVADTGGAAVAAPAGVLAPAHHFVSELYRFGDLLLSVDNASSLPGQPRVWDVSQPSSPVELGTVNTVADASGLAVAGGYLFVSTFHEGLSIYAWDPGQPLAASLVASLAVGSGAWDIALTPDGQSALLASDVGLALVNVANPAAPALLDTEPAPYDFTVRLAARGSRVFAAAGQAALQVFDVSASSISFAFERGLRGAPVAGAQLGSDVFLAAHAEGVLRLSAGDTGSPTLTGQVGTGGAQAQSATTLGNRVVVGVLDEVVVFDPASLAETGRAAVPDFNLVWDMAAGADTLFVAAGNAGVCAVEVAGGVPTLRACLDTDGEALGVALDGARLYVADSANGVLVVDVTDPASMQPLDRYPEAWALDVAVAGAQLFVSDFNNGNGRLLLLDRGAGAALSFATEHDTRGFVDDIETANDLVYLANQAGLEVLQQTSASSLVEWAWYDSAGGASDVLLVGAHAYLMDGANGLLVLSVSPTGTPPTPAPGPGQIEAHVPLILR